VKPFHPEGLSSTCLVGRGSLRDPVRVRPAAKNFFCVAKKTSTFQKGKGPTFWHRLKNGSSGPGRTLKGLSAGKKGSRGRGWEESVRSFGQDVFREAQDVQGRGLAFSKREEG